MWVVGGGSQVFSHCEPSLHSPNALGGSQAGNMVVYHQTCYTAIPRREDSQFTPVQDAATASGH